MNQDESDAYWSTWWVSSHIRNSGCQRLSNTDNSPSDRFNLMQPKCIEMAVAGNSRGKNAIGRPCWIVTIHHNQIYIFY